MVQSLVKNFVEENWIENEQRKKGKKIAECGNPTSPSRSGTE
jgi:hypothetical protein